MHCNMIKVCCFPKNALNFLISIHLCSEHIYKREQIDVFIIYLDFIRLIIEYL